MRVNVKNVMFVSKAQSKPSADRHWQRVTIHDPETFENFELYAHDDFRFPNNVMERTKVDIVLELAPYAKGLSGKIVDMMPATVKA